MCFPTGIQCYPFCICSGACVPFASTGVHQMSSVSGGPGKETGGGQQFQNELRDPAVCCQI